MNTIKNLTQSSPSLTSIPSCYTFTTNLHGDEPISDQHDSIPTIDFSLLTSKKPQERLQIIHQLGQACQNWGFFMLINHGVPESLMKGVLDGCRDFFDLSEEEKVEFQGKHVLDPIRCGTSFNSQVEKVFFWRDFLKVFVHPEFHMPNKPVGFREISLEYSKRIRVVARELLKGISESLGLEECYIDKELNVESGLQVFVANLYPACPQPELAMGLPPHSDHGLLSVLIQNEVGGLQLQHNGKWVNVNPIHNSFLVNTGDHLEILSNGKYKSVVHRAVVNNKATRISLVIANGPSLETVVSPAPELLHTQTNPPAFNGIKYKHYLELQQGNKLDMKSCLDRVRI